MLTLISRGANVNGSSLSRTHPLYEAAKQGYHACVKQLLKAGADVNALNGEVWTAKGLSRVVTVL